MTSEMNGLSGGGGGLVGDNMSYQLGIVGRNDANYQPSEFAIDISNAHQVVLTYQINASWESSVKLYYKLDDTTVALSSVSVGVEQTVTIDVSSADTFTVGGYATQHSGLLRKIWGTITVS